MRPHLCKFRCGKSYGSASALKKHYKSKHDKLYQKARKHAEPLQTLKILAPNLNFEFSKIFEIQSDSHFNFQLPQPTEMNPEIIQILEYNFADTVDPLRDNKTMEVENQRLNDLIKREQETRTQLETEKNTLQIRLFENQKSLSSQQEKNSNILASFEKLKSFVLERERFIKKHEECIANIHSSFVDNQKNVNSHFNAMQGILAQACNEIIAIKNSLLLETEAHNKTKAHLSTLTSQFEALQNEVKPLEEELNSLKREKGTFLHSFQHIQNYLTNLANGLNSEKEL